MPENFDSSSEQKIALVSTCPHLGLLKDVQTCYRTPSPSNYCHYVKNVSPVNLAHQEEFCLGEYNLCFVIQEELDVLPKIALGAVISPAIQRKRRLPYLIGAGVFLITLFAIGLMAVFGFFQSNSGTPGDDTQDGILENTEGVRPQKTKTSGTTTTPNALSTVTPQLATNTQVIESITKTPISVLFEGSKLGTPMGREDAYIVHQVAPNESMTFLLNAYHTNMEAFQYVNQNQDIATLWAGDVLVLPYRRTETQGLHSLTAIYVDSYYIISDFCAAYTIDEENFREFNDIDDHIEQLKADQWVLLPYDGTIGIRRLSTPTPIFAGDFHSPPLGPENEYLLHQVTYESTLFEVAYQYRSTEAVLAKLNGLEENATLILGQILIVQPDSQEAGLTTRLVKVHIINPIKTSNLATIFGWNKEIIRQYNQLLGEIDPMLEQQWVIYPYDY